MEDYQELCDYTHVKGMDYTSTPFDYASADYLEPMVDFYKIASADLSNLPFVEHIRHEGKPMVVSVGAAYLSEVDEAVRVIKNSGMHWFDASSLRPFHIRQNQKMRIFVLSNS